MSAAPDTPRTAVRRRTRILRLIVLIILVLATLALAWWQYTRWSESGSFQNLGYALQWPCFGAFFIYVWKKIGDYEDELAETGVSPTVREKQQQAAQGDFSEIDPALLPERPTLDVDTFNELNKPQRRRGEIRDDFR
ncbi:hypothetical protein ACFPVT_09985 [Corynebacterium choanae]|uniref:DNA-binding transcriptional regulator of glucitol operon n=1 Tax=Corynebacterium choanae TaxID=1862358 RepID=A0A3G6JBW8_9CORY|nr:hypothetical protein [Corynebacterium choanae]AZA14170.1 hypothetical protein CCHOA_08930 [Corynebacterium choanae]